MIEKNLSSLGKGSGASKPVNLRHFKIAPHNYFVLPHIARSPTFHRSTTRERNRKIIGPILGTTQKAEVMERYNWEESKHCKLGTRLKPKRALLGQSSATFEELVTEGEQKVASVKKQLELLPNLPLRKSIELRKIHHSVGYDSQGEERPSVLRAESIKPGPTSLGGTVATNSPRPRKKGLFKSDFQPKVTAVRESEKIALQRQTPVTQKKAKELRMKSKYYDVGALRSLNFRNKKLNALRLHFYDKKGGLTHDKHSLQIVNEMNGESHKQHRKQHSDLLHLSPRASDPLGLDKSPYYPSTSILPPKESYTQPRSVLKQKYLNKTLDQKVSDFFEPDIADRSQSQIIGDPFAFNSAHPGNTQYSFISAELQEQASTGDSLPLHLIEVIQVLQGKVRRTQKLCLITKDQDGLPRLLTLQEILSRASVQFKREMRHAFLLSGREMVRIEDLDYQTQNVIFVVKYYEDLFDLKRMPRALQMIEYLNNQDLYRQQRASLSQDALHEMRGSSHLAVNIPSVSGGGTDEQKSHKDMMKTRIYESYYSSKKGRILGRAPVPFSQYVELMTESKAALQDKRQDEGTSHAGKPSQDAHPEQEEARVLKRDKKQKSLIPLLAESSQINTLSHSLFEPDKNTESKEVGAPSTAQALIKTVVEELRVILEAKENDVRKEIALAWVVEVAGGVLALKSPSPVSDLSGSSNMIWNEVGGSFSPQKPSKEYKAVNLERLDALLRGLSSPNMLEVSTSNPGLSDKLRAQINSINGKKFEASLSHPSKNLLKSIKFDMQNFCKFTERESQELFQLFKELCSEVGSFSQEASESELDLQRFLDFLHHFSKESKSHFKRILKFSKVGLNGKLAWEEFALGVREAVCIRLLESIELLIATIDKFKTSQLFWDDIWELAERFILFVTREYSLLEGSLLREITDYLTKQFFEYMGVEYKEGIALVDLKEGLLEGEEEKQLFLFALLSVRESDLSE